MLAFPLTIEITETYGYTFREAAQSLSESFDVYVLLDGQKVEDLDEVATFEEENEEELWVTVYDQEEFDELAQNSIICTPNLS